jgi:Protein of unknown function (DUF1553)/Protein of unknown function (DUF1549)
MHAALRHCLAWFPLLAAAVAMAAGPGNPAPEGWANLPKLRSRGPIRDTERQWWAIQPLYPGSPPASTSEDVHPIDAWVRASLKSTGGTLAPPAAPSVLIRRMSFDLLGVPPTPSETAAFETAWATQGRETAVASLADRLLASPGYGERWGRHWLDLVRYAESDGYRVDDGRPEAWRYRDWVIQALNEDLPYDQFVQAQIAGDELWPEDPLRARVATGYLRHWMYEYNNRDARTQWQTILNDITDVTADVFLGMGLQCARCHDHKYDPLLQKDYFRLQAFFAPIQPREDLPVATAAEIADYERRLASWKIEAAGLLSEIEALEAPVRVRAEESAVSKFPEDIQELLRRPREKRSVLEHQIAELAYRQVTYEFDRLSTHYKKPEKEAITPLREKLREFEKRRPRPLPRALTVTDVGPEAPVVRMPRGDAEAVEPGVPSVIDARPATISRTGLPASTTGRRTALARWMTNPGNPLTARVIVNRLWQQHFGTGLAASANDFGTLGERPSHPELLDWLAADFIRSGWSLKHVHRRIVTSATYGQAAARPRLDGSVPDARRLEGFPLRRLDSEQLRDALLAVSGELDPRAGGPAVDGAVPRRSVYTRVLRNRRDPLLGAFDSPEQFCSTARRNTTTTPTQALLMLNSEFVEQRARFLASRIEEGTAPEPAAQVNAAFRSAYGRPPSPAELRDSTEFLLTRRATIPRETPRHLSPYRPDRQALADLCHALLNSNEFLHVD